MNCFWPLPFSRSHPSLRISYSVWTEWSLGNSVGHLSRERQSEGRGGTLCHSQPNSPSQPEPLEVSRALLFPGPPPLFLLQTLCSFFHYVFFFPTSSKNHTCIVTAPLSSNTTVLCQPTWSLWKQFRVRSLCGEPIPDQTGDLHYDTISQWPHRERV